MAESNVSPKRGRPKKDSDKVVNEDGKETLENRIDRLEKIIKEMALHNGLGRIVAKNGLK